MYFHLPSCNPSMLYIEHYKSQKFAMTILILQLTNEDRKLQTPPSFLFSVVIKDFPRKKTALKCVIFKNHRNCNIRLMFPAVYGGEITVTVKTDATGKNWLRKVTLTVLF